MHSLIQCQNQGIVRASCWDGDVQFFRVGLQSEGNLGKA